jgi:hypothetical protein
MKGNKNFPPPPPKADRIFMHPHRKFVRHGTGLITYTL